MYNEIEIDTQYGKLVEYPLPGTRITHRRRLYSNQTTFHDLVYLNLQELIPNTELGLHQKKTKDEIIEWTEKTKKYMNMLHIHFQNRCDKKIEEIESMKRQEAQQSKFVSEEVATLPEDIQKVVLSFLPAETYLILLQQRYPNIQSEMKKWKAPQLKTFYKEVVIQKYIYKIREDCMNKCLSTTTFSGVSMTTKGAFIAEIFRLIQVLNSATPRILSKYYIYKQQATNLMKSVIYVNNKIVKPPVENAPKKKEPKKKIT
jgi:hypothetical protein